MSPRRMPTTLLALFFASGASALLYEVVWTRLLTLHFGATAVGLAAVLSSFMGGMALGNAAMARWGRRIERPLRVYGLVELGIAAMAALVPTVIELCDGPLARAYGAQGPGTAFGIMRFAVAVLALAPPTFFMGATLPVLTQALCTDRARLGELVGKAYALNTLGAMTGAFLTGFVLIHGVGMRATLMIAVATNAMIGLAALGLSRRAPSTLAAPPNGERDGGSTECGENPSTSDGEAPVWIVVSMCGLSGLTSLAYEVLWTRYFVNSFMSTVTAFSTILIAYLGGLAIGAYVASVLSRRARITLLHLGLVQGVVALLGLGLLRLFESLPEWFLLLAVKAGSVDTARVLVVVSTMLLPVCLMGMVLPLGMHLLRRGRAKVSSTVGLLAAASSAGSTAGPLLAAFVALPLLGLARSIVAVAALQAVACLGLALRRGPGSSAITSRWGAAALVLGVSALAMGATQAARYGAGVGGAGVGGRGVLPPQLVIGQSERVLHYRETSHGTVVVSANETTGARTLFIDGFAATSNSGTTAYMRMMSHLPALALSHTPESVLVICLGTGITLGAASLYRPSTLDCVELNPEVVPCTGFFREENHDVLSNPSVRLVIDDGRNWLRMSGRRYDVITLEPLAPFFAGTVSLYTREFNALARAHLTPGGIFTQWLPLHLVSDRDARSIVRAVTAEFPHVIVWKLVGDVSAIILASERPIDLGAGGARPDAAREDVVRYLPAGTNVADHVVLDEAGVAAYVAGVSPLSDDRPTVEYRALGHERLRLGSKELSDANTTRLREAAGLPPEK